MSQIIPWAVKLTKSKDEETTVSALCALCFIAERLGRHPEQILSNKGFPGFIVAVLGSGRQSLVVPALQLVGHILTGDDDVTQILLDAGLIKSLLPILEHSSPVLRKDACWALSNIFAGNTIQVQRAVLSGALIPIARLICNETVQNVQLEANWCLANALEVATEKTLPVIAEVPDLLPALVIAIETQNTSLSQRAIASVLNLIQYGESIKVEGDSNPFVGYLYTHAREVIEREAEAGSVNAQSILEFFLPNNAF